MLLTVLRRVFAHGRYIYIAALVSLIALSVAILIPNTNIILQVFASHDLSLGTKLSFLGSMYGILFTNFSVLSALYTVLIALLFGINSALLTYYIRRRQSKVASGGGHTAGVMGVVSGLFGVGCAACGSVILSGLLTLLGAGGLLAALPLHGAEFGLLGVLLLSFSVYQLGSRISDPLVCPS